MVKFDSAFEGGNLDKAVQTDHNVYQLTLKRGTCSFKVQPKSHSMHLITLVINN